jgi:hypothetical protein
MKKATLAGAGLLALSALPVAAQAQSGAWLHVRVEESRKAEKVAVNLPMSVVEAVLEASPGMIEKHGRIRLGDEHGPRMADLRKAWKALAEVGDAELVTVESEEENVRVRRTGDIVQVLVDKKAKPSKDGAAGRAEEVRIEVPVSLVDAFLAGEGEGGDIKAAVAELKKRRGDIVRVTDEDSHVRIWIDEQAAPAPAGK